MKKFILIFSLLFSTSLYSQTIIDISVKGISNTKKDGAQQDRLEAIVDAKRQACEKAGIKIQSKTDVKNFQVVYDHMEASSEGILLPNFQIIDIGYTTDGTYQVVLSGKVKKSSDDNISNKELRYAKSLHAREKHSQCIDILVKYIDNKENDISEELMEQAFYLFIKWGYARDIVESCAKFEAYYPESKYLSSLRSFSENTVKPLIVYSKEKMASKKDWTKFNTTHKNKIYSEIITLENDTLLFKDYKNTEHKIIVKYNLYTNKKEGTNGYSLSINYLTPDGKNLKVIDRFRDLSAAASKSYQFMTGNSRFSNFVVTDIEIKGSVPVDKPAKCTVKFKIMQRSF